MDQCWTTSFGKGAGMLEVNHIMNSNLNNIFMRGVEVRNEHIYDKLKNLLIFRTNTKFEPKNKKNGNLEERANYLVVGFENRKKGYV